LLSDKVEFVGQWLIGVSIVHTPPVGPKQLANLIHCPTRLLRRPAIQSDIGVIHQRGVEVGSDWGPAIDFLHFPLFLD
jgi:hypothetical protein